MPRKAGDDRDGQMQLCKPHVRPQVPVRRSHGTQGLARAEDHIVIQRMKEKRRKDWKEMMNKITKDLIHLTTTTTSHNIRSEIIDIHTIENKVNTLQDLLLASAGTEDSTDTN